MHALKLVRKNNEFVNRLKHPSHLNEMLQMITNASTNIYKRGCMLPPPTVALLINKQINNDLDTVEKFINECPQKSTVDWPVSDMYDRYCEFCNEDGSTLDKKNKFLATLKLKGYPKKRSIKAVWNPVKKTAHIFGLEPKETDIFDEIGE